MLQYEGHKDPLGTAIQEVKTLIHHPDQLARVTAHRADYANRKHQIDMQLASAVRTQVDETRMGLELLLNSAEAIARIQNNFQVIDKYCHECKELLKEYDQIRRVSTARRNLDTTIKLLTYFRSIPLRAESLIRELDRDDHKIKQIYKGLRMLVQLKDKACEQGLAYSASFKAQTKGGFEKLQRVADEVEDRVWENVRDCLVLAEMEEDRPILIRTLEVIEMEDIATRKVFNGLDDEEPEAPVKSPYGYRSPSASPSASNAAPPKRSHSQEPLFRRAIAELENAIMEKFSPLLEEEETARMKNEEEKRRIAKKQKIIAKKKAKMAQEQQAASPKHDSQNGHRDRDDDDDEGEGEEDEDGFRVLKSPTKSQNHHSNRYDDDDDDAHNSSYYLGGANRKRAESDDDDDDAIILPTRDEGAKMMDNSKHVLWVLEEVKDLVFDLSNVRELLEPVFPPKYDIVHFFESRYRKYLKMVLQVHTSDTSKLSKASLPKIVGWIQWYMYNMKLLNSLSASEEEEFKRYIGEIMVSFVKTLEGTIMKLANNIWRFEKHEGKVDINERGQCFSTAPQDFFSMIYKQVDIVLQEYRLAGTALLSFTEMIVDVINAFQKQQIAFMDRCEVQGDRFFFGTERIEKEPEFFAALVNNAQLCQDNLDSVKDSLMARIEEHLAELADDDEDDGVDLSDPTRELTEAQKERKEREDTAARMEELLDECALGFVSVATRALETLAAMVHATLDGGPYKQMFSLAWLNEGAGLPDVLSTMDDFFGDFRHWLKSPAFFERVVRGCLVSLVAEYVRRLTLVKPTMGDQLFSRLESDERAIVKFFCRFATRTFTDKTITEQTEALHIVKNFAQEKDVEFLSVFFPDIIRRFGAVSCEVLEGLLAIKPDISKKERMEVMDKFKRSLPENIPGSMSASSASNLKSPGSEPQNKKGAPAAGQKKDQPSDANKKGGGFFGNFLSRQKDAGSQGRPASNSVAANNSRPKAKSKDDEDALDLNDFLS